MLNKMIKMRNKKGFTLIELIVVLVIMAVIAAMAVPAMMGYVDQAKKSSYLANCRAVYLAGQAAITEELATGTVDGSTIVAKVNVMVPELKDKVAAAAATGKDLYVYTLLTDGAATNPKVIGIKSVSFYKGTEEYVTADYSTGKTNVDGTPSATPEP